MRSRGIGVIAVGIATVLLVGSGSAYVLSRRHHDGPQEIAHAYFTAWGQGALDRMERLVSSPPGDFAAQHRAVTRGLSVTSVSLAPGPLARDGRTRAHQDFVVSRNLSGHDTWSYRSTLRLGVVAGDWKVLWSPGTLHPVLRGPGSWKMTQVEAPAARLVARDGGSLPEDGSLQPYLTELTDRFGGVDDAESGWAVEFQDHYGRSQRLKLFGVHPAKKIRTTLDKRLQAAADHALNGVSKGAAIVALRPSTGEILAVADRLGGRNAFLGLYPPGSTFKVITAAALLSDGMSAGSTVRCPGTVVTGQRTIRNHDGSTLGATTLRDAFAASCNTTFTALAVERLPKGELTRTARRFGFNGPVTPGVAAARGSLPEPAGDAELAEAAFGQGRVQASPLMMASVAAAVADGTWRPPRMVDSRRIREAEDPVQPARPVGDAAALRTMMRAVVTDGTAAGAGLPSGTAGKTGTAEYGDGASHAWFIGYRGDLAFAVFVEGGGSGPKVAAPLAARFLRSR
ncbi:MAG TPA: penicillin-binding transpeptidase domain-containing protein [Actinomadura sp.]|jgi:hypothetical protein|nr:penicillin-binding transpeptidase domain-containing protein [Actinomadura sp.]